MSCIYGTHQFGFEEQGWATWFAIATLKGNEELKFFGDGNQVRDMLWVEDLVEAYYSFVNSPLENAVFNMGGGPSNTLSLYECVHQLVDITGKPISVKHYDWRPSDQRVYTTDIRPAMEQLKWEPKVSPREGLERVVEWAKPIIDIF
jgi:CDP-paratose 2-epimerase